MRGSKPGERRGGRQKGTGNKLTPPKRAFLAAFVDENLTDAMDCWKLIEDPKSKFEAYLKASEFVHGRRATVAVTGDAGGPLVVQIVKSSGEEP